MISNNDPAYIGMKNYVDASLDAEIVSKLNREWCQSVFVSHTYREIG